MRKFLTHLLMLVMLTPGLACGPFMGMGKAQAAAVEQMPTMPDCPSMAAGRDSGGKKSSDEHSTMLFKDCAKADLYGTDHVSLKKPDVGKVFFMAWADMAPVYAFTPADFHTIRGPPPDWPNVSKTKPAIILTTLRFRE